MDILTDKTKFPELFEIEITPLMDLKRWGVVITDSQIIVFRRGDGEKWESHPVNTENVLYRAFPDASYEQMREMYLNRIVLIVCTPLKMFIVRVPEESNLSANQHNSVLKFLESIKGTDLGSDMDFEGRCVVFKLGTTQYEETLDGAIEMLQGMKPQFSGTNLREKTIGITTADYLDDEQRNKPRT